MALTCTRCGQPGEPAPAARIPFGAALKQRVQEHICAACWKEWEGMEVKVINEYRLNFMDPAHREMLKTSCLDFLGMTAEEPAKS
jgi:Fe-S cluster biosynthesis and repair protein YggX